MKRTIRVSAVFFASALAVAGTAAWVTQSGAAARPHAGVTTVQPAGINFGLHASNDTNYCLEDVATAAGTSPVSLQQCAARDGQHWAFVVTPKGAPGLIDGSGMCAQFGGTKALSIELAACTLKAAQEFLYSASGQITTANGKDCLQYAQAASGAFVTMPKCVAGLATQKWILSH
jgi:Ricin-type beta-trefoil lectin domain